MAATLNLTGYDGERLARMTASAAARALNEPGYRADCEAWAQHWWGLPYEVVRHKTQEELEEFTADQIPGRDLFVGVNAYWNLATGRNGAQDIYHCKQMARKYQLG